jgi:hypothetical protein
MGQFTTRPQEPAEWAGLPSEPAEIRSAAESLAAPAAAGDPLALWGGAVESIVIPVIPVVEIAQTATDPAEGDPPV